MTSRVSRRRFQNVDKQFRAVAQVVNDNYAQDFTVIRNLSYERWGKFRLVNKMRETATAIRSVSAQRAKRSSLTRVYKRAPNCKLSLVCH